MASVDLSALDASLKTRKEKGEGLMVKKMTDGWGKVEGFKKLRVIDSIVLGSMTFASLAQPGAKGAFNPKANALKVAARIGKVRPAKIDLLITEVERLQLEATYFAEVEGTNGRDPENFMFADHIYEHVVEQAGVDTLKAVWRGDLNPAGTNAVDICDGIVTLIDADIASDDIPETAILAHADPDFFIEEDNIIAEIKALVKLFRSQLPAYAYGPATLFMAPERASEYEFALEALNGQVNTYNSFSQMILYFAKNIKIEAVIDLAGTDFMAITPDGNLLYLTDRDAKKVSLDSDYNKRDRSVAMMADWHFAPNYFRADLIVTNDLRVRPVEAGV
ncbi:hypothetical protein [Dyadobacter sp. CY323]|uniref:hypothetical protein n=1 Tax=Dyadobacter sp. CY323 TaxID=2907302 RepID=UPI001F2578E4|nr:hypothetical protein [Dyadobacter sp. CY323]MCE6987490.1 hypothetical protein [Dyadobacter sp. CY323]